MDQGRPRKSFLNANLTSGISSPLEQSRESPIPPLPLASNSRHGLNKLPNLYDSGDTSNTSQCRSNTAPSTLYPGPSTSRPRSGRPRTAPGLPTSLMPGYGPEKEQTLNPYEDALLFQSRLPPPITSFPRTRSSTLLPQNPPRPPVPPKIPLSPPDDPLESPVVNASNDFKIESPQRPKGPRSTSHSEERSVAGREPGDIERSLALSPSDRGDDRTHGPAEDEELAEALKASLAMYTSESTRQKPYVTNEHNYGKLFETSDTKPQEKAYQLQRTPRRATIPAPYTSATGKLMEFDSASAIRYNFPDLKAHLAQITQDEERRRVQLEKDEQLAWEIAREEIQSGSLVTKKSSVVNSSPLEMSGFTSTARAIPLPRYEDAVRESRSPSVSITTPEVGQSTLSRSSVSCMPSIGHTGRPQLTQSISAPATTSASVTTNGTISTQTIPLGSEERSIIGQKETARKEVQRTVQQNVSTRPKLDTTSAMLEKYVDRSSRPSSAKESLPESASRDTGSPLKTEEHSSNPSPVRQMPIEDSLLVGVSFGFSPPVISLAMSPMQGPLPNIISLPYGKCPPLHIQAPSWRQLLKLLTRMSEARIEPTVEALAGTKADLKLRTVVQFVKVHHASNDWRTILYLSLDVPVPQTTPNAFKYVNGDVSTLPFSYTLQPLPALLRDVADANLVKYYTIPSTNTTPYPSLPIKLPNFAMYLQSALEDSRRTINDSSSGLRRLAKMVDGFYPAEDHDLGPGPEAVAPDRLRVGGLFKKAFGRGDKNAMKNGRGGNADTYEFITPFRLDEWG